MLGWWMVEEKKRKRRAMSFEPSVEVRSAFLPGLDDVLVILKSFN